MAVGPTWIDWVVRPSRRNAAGAYDALRWSPRHRLRHTREVSRKLPAVVPPTLRSRLEIARLDTLALMRALDHLHLAGDLLAHPMLRGLFELDADCAEALSVLLRPPGFAIDWTAMVRDTEATLRRLPAAREKVRRLMGPDDLAQLLAHELALRESLGAAEAYNGIQGPTARIR